MTNPLTREVKGYPVYGWLIFFTMIVAMLLAMFYDKMPTNCTPEGECVEQF